MTLKDIACNLIYYIWFSQSRELTHVQGSALGTECLHGHSSGQFPFSIKVPIAYMSLPLSGISFFAFLIAYCGAQSSVCVEGGNFIWDRSGCLGCCPGIGGAFNSAVNVHVCHWIVVRASATSPPIRWIVPCSAGISSCSESPRYVLVFRSRTPYCRLVHNNYSILYFVYTRFTLGLCLKLSWTDL